MNMTMEKKQLFEDVSSFEHVFLSIVMLVIEMSWCEKHPSNAIPVGKYSFNLLGILYMKVYCWPVVQGKG